MNIFYVPVTHTTSGFIRVEMESDNPIDAINAVGDYWAEDHSISDILEPTVSIEYGCGMKAFKICPSCEEEDHPGDNCHS